MRVNTFTKIKIFRIFYLVISLALCAYTTFLLLSGIISNLHGALEFKDTVNLFALLFALLFECGIVMFIIRSMRSQTLLMKNLVFKQDGTPYRLGVVLVSVGGIVLSIVGILLLCSAYFWHLFPGMEKDMQLFIADVALIFGINLDFTLGYFLCFRHESGTFLLI